jgi:uncharacterized delta-60 repeat protein
MRKRHILILLPLAGSVLHAAPGDLDTGFNPNANNTVNSIAVQADGKVLIGGDFSSAGGTRNRIARLNADGSLDNGFNPNANSTVNSIAVQTDGKAFIGGNFDTVGGLPRSRIARLNADGSLDASFNRIANNLVSSLAVQGDGKVLIGGSFTTVGGVTRDYIARLNADGSLDTGFNPEVSGSVNGIAVQWDGKVLIGGSFSNVGGVTRNRIARLNADGSLDTGFNPNANGSVYCLAVQADGNVLMGGNFFTVGGLTRNYIARLNADGSLDTGFNPNVNSAVNSLVLQADGKVLIGGEFTTVGGGASNRIARLNADGSLDTSFNASANATVNCLAVQADGKVLMGGGFTTVGGVTRNRIARLANDPASQSLTIPDATRVRWSRGGAAPEVVDVVFEQNLDNGATWSPLGAGTRIGVTADWELTGLSLSAGAKVRATGRTIGGQNNGSNGLIRQVYPAVSINGLVSSDLGTTTATLSATVTLDEPIASVTERGFVYAPTATNSDPLIGGSGVTKVTASGTIGFFNASISGLTQGTGYSYKAYAINSQGTSYTSVGTFTTLSTNANLSNLTLSSGTLSPTFASGSTSYTASVSNATPSITATPTGAQANATIAVRVNGGSYASVTSSSPSGSLALNVGSNTVDVQVSAQDGLTQKIYTVTVTRIGLPTVITPLATNITATGAMLGGNVTADGGATVTESGVVYSATSTNNNPIIGGTGVTQVTATGTTGVFTAPITGLIQGTRYSFKAYAINSLGASYTSAESFVTLTVLGISGLDQTILSGGTAPSPSNGTDFENVAIGQVASRVYTIENSGSEPLSMTGEPLVVVEGDHANEFHVTVAPETVVQAGSTTAFEVRFAPTQPGIREATIKFAMSGITESPANFAVQGFGALPVPRRQTIAFSPPAVVYLSQSPLPLTATASSGLPVTLQLSSGLAMLSQYGLLTLTTPGTVRVQATQAGDGTHAAAPTVQRTITVKSDPSALTLVDLVKTFNGSPQAAGVIGVEPSDVTLTYKVGGVFRPEPPTEAGQYPVKAVAGGVSKTGTLIIHPASLVVQVEDKRRLVGQPNPAFTVIFDGFIGGDNLETVLTTPFRLTTQATLRSPVGSYPILASGGAVISNYKPVHRPGTLVIEGVAGSYEALLKNRDSGLPNGHLALTVPGASTSFTASLRIATETSAIAWSGPLTLSESDRLATAMLVKTVSGVNYELQVALSMSGEMSCEVRRAGMLVAAAEDGIRLLSLPKGQRSAAEGRYTVVLEPAQPAGDTVPAGAGWATGRADSQGKIMLSGRLGDGTAFTAGLPADVGEMPRYRLFVQPYLPRRTQSYAAGTFKLTPHPNVVNLQQVEASQLTWIKSGLPKDAAYRDGFGPVTTLMTMEPWQSPTATRSLATLLNLGSESQWAVEHSPSGSLFHGTLPGLVAVNARNLVSVVTPPANPRKWKMQVNPATGSYTGGFELLDVTELRKVSFSGVLRQTPTLVDTMIGGGFYMLPALKTAPNNEQTSGAVFFLRPE